MTAGEAEARFGSFGRRLALFVQGEDERKVTPFRRAKSISAETTFRQDIRAPAELIGVAARLCERVAQQLQRKQVAGHTLVLKLKTANFRLMTRNRRLPHPTQRADLLLEQAEGLIRLEADGRLFRLIGIGVSDLARILPIRLICSASRAIGDRAPMLLESEGRICSSGCWPARPVRSGWSPVVTAAGVTT
ncbi:MAG: hypothetical protein QM811_21255 [Pirellulales bacterium]